TQISPLRNEIRTLERQKKEALKAIKERYGELIRGDRRSEEALKRERTLLKEQEAALLLLATTDAQREAIRSKFQFMLKVLNGEIKMDERLIIQLQAEEQALSRQVSALFQARINQLTSEIQTLQAQGSKAGSKSPKSGVPSGAKSGK